MTLTKTDLSEKKMSDLSFHIYQSKKLSSVLFKEKADSQVMEVESKYIYLFLIL